MDVISSKVWRTVDLVNHAVEWLCEAMPIAIPERFLPSGELQYCNRRDDAAVV